MVVGFDTHKNMANGIGERFGFDGFGVKGFKDLRDGFKDLEDLRDLKSEFR